MLIKNSILSPKKAEAARKNTPLYNVATCPSLLCKEVTL
jgi:hypothetical protein